MRTLKFGGTSLANAEKFLTVAKIIKNKSKKERISVVLSAPSKITNYLEKIFNNIESQKESKYLFVYLKKFFHNLINEIKKHKNNFLEKELLKNINYELDNIKDITNKIKIKNLNLDNIHAYIISRGEIISIQIMHNILIANKQNVFIINPIQEILAVGNYLDASVKILESKLRIQNLQIPHKNIILMAGFIAGNEQQEVVTLGRNGSDYSAAILAVCLNSHTCEIWTDVDGIYTADPNIVKNPKLLKSISYEEAIELSYLGAKILHPKTISPLMQTNIICIIKNTLNPNNLGTIITNKNTQKIKKDKIQGITCINSIIMVKIKIFQPVYNYQMHEKIFSLFAKNKIEILLTTYCSIENTTNIYLSKQQANTIRTIFNNHFDIEIKNQIFQIIKIIEQLSIISIIGNNIKKNKTIQSKILNVLKNTNLNILLINNELSKKSISIITDSINIEQNIKTIHKILFNKKKIIEIFMIGCGGVGQTLIKQFIKQKHYLKKKNIKFQVCSIANSKKMILKLNGIILDNWKKQIQKTNEKFCIKKIIQTIKNSHLFNPVIIDCTSSENITKFYPEILKNKIHIVTPNKKANTSYLDDYKNIRKTAIKYNKKFLYETNVGAGLPIIQTLKHLFYSGDELISFRGILSGSLSFIFGKLEEGMSISQATQIAQKLGFTEPNPKDDLSGMDVARKLLILAREVGYKLELKDIKIKPILKQELLNITNTDKFLYELSKIDNIFFDKIKNAQNNNKVLRFIGTINNIGKCKVKLSEINESDPLYSVKNGENAIIIYSKYYQPIPLVLRGYGAGNNVTAAGIFSDILQTLS